MEGQQGDSIDTPIYGDSDTDNKMDCTTRQCDQVQEEDKKEEEKTLTDHLNKKLLESFLQRMDKGEFDNFKTRSLESDNEEEWTNQTHKSDDKK